jgi:hypothetical protein
MVGCGKSFTSYVLNKQTSSRIGATLMYLIPWMCPKSYETRFCNRPGKGRFTNLGIAMRNIMVQYSTITTLLFSRYNRLYRFANAFDSCLKYFTFKSIQLELNYPFYACFSQDRGNSYTDIARAVFTIEECRHGNH